MSITRLFVVASSVAAALILILSSVTFVSDASAQDPNNPPAGAVITADPAEPLAQCRTGGASNRFDISASLQQAAAAISSRPDLAAAPVDQLADTAEVELLNVIISNYGLGVFTYCATTYAACGFSATTGSVTCYQPPSPSPIGFGDLAAFVRITDPDCTPTAVNDCVSLWACPRALVNADGSLSLNYADRVQGARAILELRCQEQVGVPPVLPVPTPAAVTDPAPAPAPAPAFTG